MAGEAEGLFDLGEEPADVSIDACGEDLIMRDGLWRRMSLRYILSHRGS